VNEALQVDAEMGPLARTLVLTSAVATTAGCWRIEPGVYRCDEQGRCPAPLVCVDDFCAEEPGDDSGPDPSDAGYDAGATDAGDAGATDAGDAGATDAGDAGALDAGFDAGPRADAGVDGGAIDPLPASTSTVSLGTFDDDVLGLALDVDETGRPHVVSYALQNVPTEQRLRYHSCEAPCTQTGDWHDVLLTDLGVGDLRPDIAAGADGRAHVALVSNFQIFYSSCTADCANAANWDLTLVSAGPTNPRIAVDDTHVWIASCAAPVSGGWLTIHHCALPDCASTSDWSSFPLADTCAAVDDVEAGGGAAGEGVAVLSSSFAAGYQLQHAGCVSGCTVDSAWSRTQLAGNGASNIGGAYRSAGGAAALLDVAAGTVATCSDCAPGVPSTPWSLTAAQADGDARLAFTTGDASGVVRVLGDAADGSWDVHVCEAPCSAQGDWRSTDFLAPGVGRVTFDVDDRGLPVVVHSGVDALSAALTLVRGEP
jgi:hypothetical protein